jgi:hypothetical protein
MDYQSAQSEYDLALEALTKAQSQQAPTRGQPKGLEWDFSNPILAGSKLPRPSFNSYNSYGTGGNIDLSQYQQRLDAARSALEASKNAQKRALQSQAQYGKLTGQASNALYGGILGYNPQPMTAEGGQSFAVPQGNLQQPFSNMQGILGQAQRPQFMSQGGGMGDMMQPKLRMY